MSSNILLSVVICTYNRAELLNECLKTLVVQTMPMEEYEILVIDNNCTDNTTEVVENYMKSNSIIKYCQEPNVGLSHARNRGAKEASSNNLLYLDDDILADPDLCRNTLDTFMENTWPCFGGVYTQWFYYGKPRWFPKSWNTNINDWTQKSSLPDDKFATGCVFALKKDILLKVGGFNPNYGMKGNNIGYGEETDVQIKIRQLGYEIGFNPDIRIKHVVPKHKLRIGWHLRAAWKNAKAVSSMRGKAKYPFFKSIKAIIILLIINIKYITNLKQKDYYWQNFVFDYLEPILRKTSAIYHLYLIRSNV